MAEPILLFRPIFEEVAEDITRQLIQSKDEVVDIWMNTPGGSVSSGWTILAALHETKKKANITVMGDADSFGFFMLLFGYKNKAFDTSSFMVHRAASMWEGVMNDEELSIIADRNTIIRSKMEARLNQEKFKEVTGKSFDDIFSMDDRLDVNLDAQQAKEIGLIDEVVALNTKNREKLKEIESRYAMDLAALSNRKINTNSKKMGKLKDLLFGEKDPILLASIGETQLAYSKLEVGATVKATGKEQKPISGTFEADDKIVTVVENEITAVNALDNKQKEIEALRAKLEALEANQLTAEEVAEVIVANNKKYENQISELKETLAKAKLTVSAPKLPEGEFKQEVQQPNDAKSKAYKIQKEIDALALEKQAQRNANLKNV